MKFSICRSAISLIALSCSSAALAGDEPLYQPAPDWVEIVDLSEVERDVSNSQIVNDTQIRINSGIHWEYTDLVFRVSSLSELSEVGTLTAEWLPDKGDLIVHEISILRDGTLIDLVDQGEQLEVLRREQQLEQRVLDGSLTATLSVPGLQVGDELRLRYSVTNSDQALGEEVQSQSFLWREPDTIADFARIRASWPEDLDVQYKAGPNFDLSPAWEADDHNWVEVLLPLEEADEFPSDAPLRYRRGTLLQLGTFADWAEVSSTMAPYYQTSGSLAGLDDLRKKVEAIRTGYATDLERAVAALELVQEDIRYLMNGLDGGNYLPQDVATTWEKKYGDCKAKTVILLALLEELGIEAEAVLVSTNGGNAVPISLPLPGAFDHVLVRAEIEGNLYYLDGTSLGANMRTVGNVPSFEYALPIRASGAELERIEQVLPRVPEVSMHFTFDASAGVDLPVPATMKMQFLGPAAAQINAGADKLDDERKKQLAKQLSGDMALIDVEIISGEDDSEATLVVSGISEAPVEFDGLRGESDLSLSARQLTFSPNRSRKEWRDIPVRASNGGGLTMSMEVLLPHGENYYEIRGENLVEADVAGRSYKRQTTFSDGKLSAVETVITDTIEIEPEQFKEERRKAANLARQESKLIVKEDVPRRWRYATSKDRSGLAALEAAYAKVIENDPKEAGSYLSRAGFRYDTYDFAGSLEDMNKVIELEAEAEYYSQRATVYSQLLDQQARKADLEEAYSLDPTPWRAMQLAGVLVDLRELTEAREILEYEDGDEDVRKELAIALAEIDALEGNPELGLSRIREFAIDSPNDAELLNEKCWFIAKWDIATDDGLSVCTRAVENSGDAANVLDSRALLFMRKGQFVEAMDDIDAALTLAPNQTATVLLRGLVRLEQGDKGGQGDVDEALARDPELATRYRRWGFDL